MIHLGTLRRRAIALGATALLAASAAPASAAVTYVFKGAITGGYDETGVFRLAGQELEGLGLTFTATIVREDVAGAFYDSGPGYSAVGGFGNKSPLQATITVNGQSFELGSYLGQQGQYEDANGCGPGCGTEQFIFNAQARQDTTDPVSGVTNFLNNGLLLGGNGVYTDFLPSTDYHTLGSLTGADGVDFFGELFLESYTLDSSGARTAYGRGVATLKPISMTVSGFDTPPAAVPEPASWALMILGFGSAGAMLRRRRLAVVRA
ncbi:MAG: PEPxxWA-CTERM sorting domain-containing protein [Pseudomonadota bacterium]